MVFGLQWRQPAYTERGGAVPESSWLAVIYHISVSLKLIVIVIIFACAYDFAFEPLYFPVGSHTR